MYTTLIVFYSFTFFHYTLENVGGRDSIAIQLCSILYLRDPSSSKEKCEKTFKNYASSISNSKTILPGPLHLSSGIRPLWAGESLPKKYVVGVLFITGYQEWRRGTPPTRPLLRRRRHKITKKRRHLGVRGEKKQGISQPT